MIICLRRRRRAKPLSAAILDVTENCPHLYSGPRSTQCPVTTAAMRSKCLKGHQPFQGNAP